MSMTPITPHGYANRAQFVAPPPNVQRPKAMEAFEGEKEMLHQIYDNYMKNMGGYQNINGQMVHVTTVLHIDARAQQFVMAVENRLKDLGELPKIYY